MISVDQHIELRASAMPRAFACPGSARRGRLLIDERSEPADVGSAVHEALRPLAEGSGVTWNEIDHIAERWGVEPKEVRILVAMAVKLWDRVKDSFADAITEIGLSTTITDGLLLTGHADLLSVGDRVARVADWKTGRKDTDYSHQMRAYATLVLLDNPNLEEVTATILWIRDEDIENYTLRRADALAWIESVRSTVVEWNGVYHPGDHCGYCPRSHECEAATALARRDTAAILDIDVATAIAAMPADQVVTLYKKAAAVEKCAERVRSAVKARVEAEGSIVSDEGVLSIETERRRELDAMATWPILEEAGFQDEDFAACIDLRVSKLEKRVVQRAGRGKGAAAVRALNEKLTAAGAVSTTEVQKLVVKRKAG